MNRQMSFSESEFTNKKHVTRKEAFLAVMEKVVPWERLVERLEAHYPKGERGRPPKGTIVDATIVAAPSSTKNERKQRDPEMHQTKKGNQWHFGMKAHIGVDAHSGLVHSVTATAANEADINQTEHLLHGEETAVFADAGYTGAEKREEIVAKAPRAKYHVAPKRGRVKAMSVRKGHRYVSVFCDMVGKRVLFAVPGKDKKVWESFAAALADHNGHHRAIEEVSMDMSPAYIAGVKENMGD